MSKTSLIIKREYLTRVKKKSFIIMTILGPVLMAASIAIIFFLSKDHKENYKMLVVDDTTLMADRISYNIDDKIKAVPDDKHSTKSDSYTAAIIDFKTNEKYKEYDFLLWLPKNVIDTEQGVGKLVYRKAPGLEIEKEISIAVDKAREANLFLVHTQNDSLFKSKFRNLYHKIRTQVAITPVNADNFDDAGNEIDENDDFKIRTGIGLALAGTVFFFIFFFGTQVMRGVIEEKTNRIVEVIISSIKPFQLMLGKIVGVGLVGLTQFLIWLILGGVLISVTLSFFNINNNDISQMSTEVLAQNSGNIVEIDKNLAAILGAPWLNIILSFLFYFLAGYLLYSALFAAIGAAVDNETDSQQFQLPITAPLLLTFYVIIFSAFKNPDSEALYWLSMIPLTSPVAMLVRVAMGSAELWEVLVSMGLLVGTFILTTWIAGKVYRTGILMYGKKPSYKEIFKWIKHN